MQFSQEAGNVKGVLSWLLPTLVFVFLAACTTQPKYSPRDEYTEPLSEEIRRNIRVVGVVHIHGKPEGDFELALRGIGESAAKGTAAGAAYGAAAGLTHAHGDLFALILLVPVGIVTGAIAGGVTGAAQAVPEEKAARLEADMIEVLNSNNIQAGVYQATLKELRENTGYQVSELDGKIKRSGDGYPNQASKGIDTILEVDTRAVGIVGGIGREPLLRLFLIVRARLFRTAARDPIYAHTFSYLGPAKEFSAWGSNKAAALRDEMKNAYRSVSERIVEEIFLELRS